MKLVVFINGSFKETKTYIEVGEYEKLSNLANKICSKLSKFNDELIDEHLYRFTDNLKNPFHNNPNKVNYDKRIDNNDYPDSNTKNAYHTNIIDVFNCKNKKMLFAFDFGSTIEIIVRRLD